MADIPDWASDHINEWCDVLCLQCWKVVTKLSPHPNNDQDNHACVTLYPEIVDKIYVMEYNIDDEVMRQDDHRRCYQTN